jgi:hypothetical protein
MNGSPAITEEAARAIGVDAYLYFYPLISVDIKVGKRTTIYISGGKGQRQGASEFKFAGRDDRSSPVADRTRRWRRAHKNSATGT